MNTVLIAIAPQDKLKLTDQHVSTISSLLNQPKPANWLSDGEACEVEFATGENDDLLSLENEIRFKLDNIPIDLAILPNQNRKKKLLVADMDSTMIGQECLDELADIAGVGDKVKQITARAMAGELDFEAALTERMKLLAGMPVEIISRTISERITLTPGAVELVQTMKANGAYCGLISGGFSNFTSYIARLCGFDEEQANSFEVKDGKLTGNPVPPILGKKAKLRAIAQMTMMNALSFADTMAVGDGANDIAMLQRANIGVALHGKPIVREAARVRIDHCDLTSLLFLQGYKRSEFVTTTSKGVEITTSRD